MLVLSRKPGETIQVGDDITIMVVAVRGNVVRLGIEAPKDVPIVRSEIKVEPQPEKPAAIANGVAPLSRFTKGA